MKFIKFSESIEIKSSPESIFDYTQDYENRLKWDTFLIKAYLLNNAIRADKGVKAWCVAKNGFGMEIQYISFNPPKVAAVKMTRGPYIFKDFAASWTFKEEMIGTTKVTFLYSFSLRFPFTIATLFIKSILCRNVRKRLINLKIEFSKKTA